MPLPTWDQLEKNQTDDEKIEAAINRLIAAHNDDANAHIGAGRSLNSHKASAVIDHLAASIIADKLKDFEVTVKKLGWDKVFRYVDWASLDSWDVSPAGKASIGVGQCTIIANNETSYILARPTFDGLESAKNPYFQVRVGLYNHPGTVYFGAGEVFPRNSYEGFGFKIVNGTVYAWHSYLDGSSVLQEVTTQIGTISGWNAANYKAIMDWSGGNIKFYVNDVLKATHSSNLPNEFHDDRWFEFRNKNLAVGNAYVYIGDFFFVQDF